MICSFFASVSKKLFGFIDDTCMDNTCRLLILEQILSYLKDNSLETGNTLFYRCQDDHFVQLVRSEYETHQTGTSFSATSSNLRKFIGDEDSTSLKTTTVTSQQQQKSHQFTYVYEQSNKRKRSNSIETNTKNTSDVEDAKDTKDTQDTQDADCSAATSPASSSLISGVNYLPLKQSHLPPKRPLPYKDGTFHAVVLILPFREVTENEFQVSLMCEMARILIPGGRIFLVDQINTASSSLLVSSSSSISSSSSSSTSSNTSSTSTNTTTNNSFNSIRALFASFFRTIIFHPVATTPNQDPASSTSTIPSAAATTPSSRQVPLQLYIYIGTTYQIKDIDRPQ